MAKKTKLGRGLGAILEEVEEAYINDIKQGSEVINEIEINQIKPNPYQPRKDFNEQRLKELSESIKENGVLQPIIVSKEEDGYLLIAGERRLRASKMAGFNTIRAIVAEIDMDKLAELALLENIQREELNAIELAKSLEELINKHHLTHEELAKKIHKSRTFVTNILRLLSLSDFTKNLIMQNRLSSGHAKALIGLSSKDEEKIVNSIINQKLSVREAEKLAREIKNSKSQQNNRTGKENNKKTPSKSFNIKPLQNELLRIVSKVKVKNNSMTIEFDSQESIDVLYRRVMH